MERAEVLARVISIVTEILEVDEECVTEASSFEELGADSLDQLELITAFEGEFDVQVDDQALESIITVSDVVDCIVQAA